MTWNERLEYLMKQGKSSHTIKEAFTLYNERVPEVFSKKETKMFCGGCVSRVWNGLTNYYNSLKTK